MDIPYIVYKNNIDDSGGACSADTDCAIYLNSLIEKFNHKYKKNIGFYSSERLSDELLKTSRQILLAELEDLLTNYHIDADPNGFSRSAMKVNILGKERILNHFSCKIDQIIYSLNQLLDFVDRTINNNGCIEIYGLGDTDVLDWNIIWSAKKMIRFENKCSINKLKSEISYIFHVDNIIDKNPNEFNDRIAKLLKNGYLSIDDDYISVTEKGQVVDVWKSYMIKKITIDEGTLKKAGNRGLEKGGQNVSD